MARPTSMSIGRDSLLHNFDRVRALAPQSQVLAMVKADAYGHGLVCVASTLKEAHTFGVASLEEAKMIRQAGLKQPILLMAGFFSSDELKEVVALQCDVVLHFDEQLSALQKARLQQPINVWLKINTGMNRLGIMPDKVHALYQSLRQCHNVNDIKLMTHFSDADNPNLPTTKNQMAIFNETVEYLEGERSLANSAGIIAFPESHADYVRPGLMLYGVSPMIGKTAQEFDLKPVMTFTSKIIALRYQQKGDAIGYGSTFICPEDMPVGIVAMGYGDGYPWYLPQGGVVLIDGIECPLAGRVSMDFLAVDLRKAPHAKVGNHVVLWGDGLPVERIAANAETIPYELLCGVAKRVGGRDSPP